MKKQLDQADELKRILNEIKNQEKKRLRNEVENLLEEEHADQEIRKIDILELPSRSEIHKQDREKARLKRNFVLMRASIIILILIIIILGSYIYWGDELLEFVKIK